MNGGIGEESAWLRVKDMKVLTYFNLYLARTEPAARMLRGPAL